MKQIFEFTCFRNDIAASYCLVKEEDKVIMKVVGVMLFLMTTFNLIVYLRKLDRIIFQPVSMDICFQYRHIHSELVLTRENCTFFYLNLLSMVEKTHSEFYDSKIRGSFNK